MWDESGDPVSVAVFSGNTPAISTFAPQILKIADQFGCKQVTVLGDRGMIKSAQIDQMPQGIHYITAITKPQSDKLIPDYCTNLTFASTELKIFSHLSSVKSPKTPQGSDLLSLFLLFYIRAYPTSV